MALIVLGERIVINCWVTIAFSGSIPQQSEFEYIADKTVVGKRCPAGYTVAGSNLVPLWPSLNPVTEQVVALPPVFAEPPSRNRVATPHEDRPLQ